MKICISIFLALILLPIQAQVSITKSDIACQKGDLHSYKITDPQVLVTNINPETAGGNVTWDFSSPNVSFLEVTSSEYVDVSATVFEGSVEGSNMVIKTAGEVNGVYQFVNISDEGIDHLYTAWYEDGNINLSTYTPAMTTLKFPMSFGQTFNQEYVVEMLQMGELFMLDSSTTSVEVDAWGTVTTPVGTFTDVLRIKRTTNSSGYMYYEGNWVHTADLSTIDYSWYKPGIHSALVNVSRFLDEAGYTMIYLTNPGITGMEAHPTKANRADGLFRIYPNPASEVLTLECSSGKISSYILFDASGRIVRRGENCASQSVVLPISDIGPGSYILEICNGTVKSRKMVIVK